MNNTRLLLCTGTLLAAAQSAAQTVPQPALACTQISDPAARLACYDRTLGAQLPPTQALPDSAEAKPAIDLEKSIEQSQEQRSPQIVLTTPPAAPTQPQAYTPLSLAYDLDVNHETGILTARAHRPMYLLPGWYNSAPNRNPSSPEHTSAIKEQQNQNHIEAKMQISFKTKLLQDLFGTNADLWFGYTQVSHWQVYQGSMSSPFRNTDYEPEIFLTQPVKASLPGGGSLRMLGIGAVHQSNGQSDPISRSWNRVYAMAGMEWGKLTVIPRLWWRLPEKSGDDDNSDINRYMGYGDLQLHYRLNNRHSLGALARYNPSSGRGGLQLDYTFPIAGRLKGYVQGFHGYGESLLDYNHKHNSIGIGVMLNDWDGL
ncbi:phospholipase [Eikenella longinqua]|uniref:Phospholipase A1 n=1 Tax=Eikenella longinqua TaxID=1795827 RepID=A0A1A9S1B4_9NEIS|nr:phospholipase A [Eikenella longinqua]OAM31181.1 phospholipase [Eikenella longinqua]